MKPSNQHRPRLPKDRMINLRVDADFDALLQAEAEKRFGGSKGLLLREAGETYITLRRRLGPQYEPTIALLTGETTDRREEILVS